VKVMPVEYRKVLEGLAKGGKFAHCAFKPWEILMQFESTDKYVEQPDAFIGSITDEFKRLRRALKVQFWQVTGTVVVIVLLGEFIERF